MPKLGTLLDQIDSGTLLLPEFQRGYVWNRDQVRGLMRSLYRDYPVGSLLVWETETDNDSVRGDDAVGSGPRRLLLDGQQRITSLYGLIRGRPPSFFQGDPQVISGLRFHVEDEVFEFHSPTKMGDDPLWMDLTRLFVDGLASAFSSLRTVPEERFHVYVERVTRLHALLDRTFHEEKITGADKTVDVIVDIFNRVNSGGTKLSKGDLALAKLCAEWPEARSVMRDHLRRWKEAGYEFSLDWLLRNANAVLTGHAQFSFLDGVSANDFRKALGSAVKYVGGFLDVVQGRLGLDHNRVLMGRYAFPVVSRFMHLNGGSFDNAWQRDRMLFWYVHSALWGRFSGTTETLLAQDYDALQREGIDGLIAALARWRGGELVVQPHDFDASTVGSRFYPLLYLLTRVRSARDFGSGIELKYGMLGHLSSLQVHHLFPKAALYRYGYARRETNAVANFSFLTQDTNLAVGAQHPEEYFAEVESRHPGALASQWIPTDPELWQMNRYRDFLAARRGLLAAAANEFLAELRDGCEPVPETLTRLTMSPSSEADDERATRVKTLVEELVAVGCVTPAFDSEIADPATGRALAVAEAYWPDGLQPGIGRPVVLELDPDSADLSRLEELGYEVFTSVEALRKLVLRRNEEAAGLRPLLEDVDGQDL